MTQWLRRVMRITSKPYRVEGAVFILWKPRVSRITRLSASDLQIDLAGVGQYALAAIAIAAVAGLALLIEMVVHLGIQCALGQKLIELVVGNLGLVAACLTMSPSRAS
jgi:hypothetical protein